MRHGLLHRSIHPPQAMWQCPLLRANRRWRLIFEAKPGDRNEHCIAFINDALFGQFFESGEGCCRSRIGEDAFLFRQVPLHLQDARFLNRDSRPTR